MRGWSRAGAAGAGMGDDMDRRQHLNCFDLHYYRTLDD
jgi:hypothetical protein